MKGKVRVLLEMAEGNPLFTAWVLASNSDFFSSDLEEQDTKELEYVVELLENIEQYGVASLGCVWCFYVNCFRFVRDNEERFIEWLGQMFDSDASFCETLFNQEDFLNLISMAVVPSEWNRGASDLWFRLVALYSGSVAWEFYLRTEEPDC